MKARAYRMGHNVDLPDAIQYSALGESVCVEFTARDGRQIQVRFDEDGRVIVRGWGNIAGKTGNRDQIGFMATIHKEEAAFCDRCYNKLEKCGCGGSKS